MILYVALVERFYARELVMLTKSRKVANGLNGEIKTYLQCRLETRRKKTFFSGVSSPMRYSQHATSHTATECITVACTHRLALKCCLDFAASCVHFVNLCGHTHFDA